MAGHTGPFALEEFEVVQSDDIVKYDRELICLVCTTTLCDVEPGDTLQVLVGVAQDHWKGKYPGVTE